MKFILISMLISLSSFTWQQDGEACDDLQYNIEVTNTSAGLNNGIIKVTIIKSSSTVKAFLYGDKKGKNKLDVKIDKLDQLRSGTYILILQNKQCSIVKNDIIIK